MLPDRPERPASSSLDPDLLGRYLAGETSDAEAAVVRRALMANPAVAGALARALDELDGGPGRPAAPDAAASWAALRDRLAETGRAHDAAEPAPLAPDALAAGAAGPTQRLHLLPKAARRHPPAATRWPRPRRVVAAAWAAGVCATTLVAGRTVLHAWHSSRASGARSADSARAAGGDRAYVTEPGQRANVLLGDGTRVRLAPGTRLRVATDFGAGRRDVYLEGEAFFDVVHDERRPFTVFAANASAQDLGTQFAVRSYPEDGAVQVVVRQGAVALSGVGALAAGDVGRLTARGRTSVRRRVDADSALRWLDGQLAYHDAPLAEVLRDVGRWYNVDAAADPALAALPFTGTLAGGSAGDAVALVAATLGLRVRSDGQQYVLQAGPGRPPPGAPPGTSPSAPPRRGRATAPVR